MNEKSKPNQGMQRQSSRLEIRKDQESETQNSSLQSEDLEVDLLIESDPNCWEEDLNTRVIQYFPLTLLSEDPENTKNSDFLLKQHIGDPNILNENDYEDIDLPQESILFKGAMTSNQPKLIICVTMYNESYRQLVETLAGIYRSYFELVHYQNAFKNKVQVVIISDGYDQIKDDTLKSLEKAGIYDAFRTSPYKDVQVQENKKDYKIVFKELSFINKENMNKDRRVYGTYNVGHCFSRSMHFLEFLNGMENPADFRINKYKVGEFLLGNSRRGRAKHKQFYYLPIPIHFCIKHRNQGKIDSHKWFFKGFCQYMNPEYTQIIDCGTIPLWNSISNLVRHLDHFTNIGACSGEIEVHLPQKNYDTNKTFSICESMVMKSQYAEYKVSHYLGKAIQSTFSFSSVLPSEFCTFRWNCIRGQPLNQFLQGAKDEFEQLVGIVGCATASKLLAEERVMCSAILTKFDQEWIISYFPSARCLTDVPKTITGLLKKRRRWFNGNLFASLSIFVSIFRVFNDRGGSVTRKVFYFFLYLSMLLATMLNFVLVGLFYATFSICVRSALNYSENSVMTRPINILESIYLIFLGLVVILSTLISKVEKLECCFKLASLFMGILTFIMIGCAIKHVYYDLLAEEIMVPVILAAICFLSFILPILLNCRKLSICNFIKGTVYLLFLAPTYINILAIYSISNIHDVSWGSCIKIQNEDTADIFEKTEQRKQSMYKNFRSNFLGIYSITNLAIAKIIIYLSKISNQNSYYDTWIEVLSWFFIVVISTKLCFSLVFEIMTCLSKRRINNMAGNFFRNVDEINQNWEDNRTKFQVTYDQDYPYTQKFEEPQVELPDFEAYSSIDFRRGDTKIFDHGINLERFNQLIARLENEEQKTLIRDYGELPEIEVIEPYDNPISPASIRIQAFDSGADSLIDNLGEEGANTNINLFTRLNVPVHRYIKTKPTVYSKNAVKKGSKVVDRYEERKSENELISENNGTENDQDDSRKEYEFPESNQDFTSFNEEEASFDFEEQKKPSHNEDWMSFY